MPGKSLTVKKKRKAGQPTKYRPVYCEQLIAHMAKGFSFDSFAKIARCHRDTLYEWRKVNPEFSDAYKRGKLEALYFFEQVGLKALNEDPKTFNTGLWVFFMKARFKWNDRPAIEALTEQIKAVTIDLPNAKKQQVITLENEG